MNKSIVCQIIYPDNYDLTGPLIRFYMPEQAAQYVQEFLGKADGWTIARILNTHKSAVIQVLEVNRPIIEEEEQP